MRPMKSARKARALRIGVLVADANVMACHLLTDLLRRYPDFEVVACVTNQDDLVRAVREAKADVALIAANLDDGHLGGFAIVQQIREVDPRLRVILLLDRPDQQLTVEAMRAGARGVFSQSHFQTAALCKCVRKVYEGQIWISTSELECVLTAFAQAPCLQIVNSAGLRLLSNREDEVMRLVAEGWGNREIAGKLGLSEHTVKNYLFHIFDKLGISNRVELVLYAITNPKQTSFSAQITDEAPAPATRRLKTPSVAPIRHTFPESATTEASDPVRAQRAACSNR